MLLWQLCFNHTCPIYDQPRANRRFPMFERACLPIGDWPIIYSIYSIMGRVICFFLTQSATLPAKKQNLSQPLWVCLPWGSVPFKTGVVGQISKPWDSQFWAMFKTNCPISFWEKQIHLYANDMGVSQTLNAKGFVYLHTAAAGVSCGIHKKPAKCQLIFTYIYIFCIYT